LRRSAKSHEEGRLVKAVVLHSAGDLEVLEAPEPVVGDSDVLLEVRAAGICGSDLASFRTGAYVGPDQILGHEFSGVLRTVGDAVVGATVGDAVTVMPLGRCGQCPSCLSGHPNVCREVVSQAVGYGYPGAMAEYVLLRGATVGVSLFNTGGLDFSSAAMVEPLAVALRAVERSGIDHGGTAAVLGLGVVGQCVLRILAYRGVDVIGVDLSPFRLRVAQTGAPSGRFGGNLAEALNAAGGGPRPNVVIDASGAPQLIESSVRAMAPTGRLVVVSLPTDGALVDLKRLAIMELEIVGSYAYHDEFAEALRLVSTRTIEVADLVTGTYLLDDASMAFAAAGDTETHLKVQLIN
jgi:threonine dehydrogenase-like Zn-dependent dehydrogenase